MVPKFIWTSPLVLRLLERSELDALHSAGKIGADPDFSLPWAMLLEPLTGISSVAIELGLPEKFTIPAGFVYDQATVPRPVRWLVSPSGPHIRRAACLHDFRCPWDEKPADPAAGEILTPAQAAEELWDGMMADGAAGWRADLVRWAVSNFGPTWEMPPTLPPEQP